MTAYPGSKSLAKSRADAPFFPHRCPTLPAEPSRIKEDINPALSRRNFSGPIDQSTDFPEALRRRFKIEVAMPHFAFSEQHSAASQPPGKT